MLVTNTFRSTHAFFGRLRDMADFHSSSPPTMQRSISNGSQTLTQMPTATPTNTPTSTPTCTTPTTAIPIDPRLLDVVEPGLVKTPGPLRRQLTTRLSARSLSGSTTEPSVRELRKRRKRRVRQAYEPVAGSFCSILHEYAGETLFAKPIMWTDTQLSAFGIKFVQLPPCQKPRPVSSEAWKQPTQSTRLLRMNGCVEMVLNPRRPITTDQSVFTSPRMSGLGGMFDIMYPGRTIRPAGGKNHMFSLFIWGAPYPHLCHLEGFWRDESSKVTMAFLDKPLLESTRKFRMFSVYKPRAGPENTAVKSLVAKRVSLVLPKDPDQDPFLAAAFIAMAQDRFYPATPESKGMTGKITKRQFRDRPMPKFADTKLRILTTNGNQTFSVYTTTVTAKVLTALHHPTAEELRSGPDDHTMDIEHTKVDVFPLLGLKERLARALGEDLVGEVNLDGMELFEDPPAADSDAEDSDGDTVAFTNPRRNPSLPSTASWTSRHLASELSNEGLDERGPAKRRRIGIDNSFVGVEEAAAAITEAEAKPTVHQ
ncbi:hypothetical protein F5X68DRAFT_263687 [Plectosphaerella plurivora]|uniref:Uncharacterized protein n=1 Tax=Plectosphaerella plurivora TaxID=936078 RepID=A0A9P9A9V9_9PEZI|nr:hypothetical protein F5X68DRAFT_263687 [Plectosphaerella plurivora]